MNVTTLTFDTVDSTNTEALKHARQGAAEGLCIIASGNPRLNGILIAADETTGKATYVHRLSLSAKELEHELAV